MAIIGGGRRTEERVKTQEPPLKKADINDSLKAIIKDTERHTLHLLIGI